MWSLSMKKFIEQENFSGGRTLSVSHNLSILILIVWQSVIPVITQHKVYMAL
jgi:hypothetical protein